MGSVSNPAIQTNPLVAMSYSPNGHLAGLAIAHGNSVADTTSFTYDGLDRLATNTWPDASTEVLSYDADGNVTVKVTRKGDAINCKPPPRAAWTVAAKATSIGASVMDTMIVSTIAVMDTIGHGGSGGRA